MIRDLALIAPIVIGSLCLLAVCGVYLRSHSFKLDGALLAVCGVGLLGFAFWQVGDDRHAADLARRLEALALLEGRIAEIADQQTRLADAMLGPRGAASPTIAGVTPAAGPAARAPRSDVLEIEVLGGVSSDELATIVGWIREAHATHRSSRIVVEPVMPLASADPDGQRRRLMNEVGRVIDHVFDKLNQKVDIATLVAEPVPGPRLRLALANS
jgi:hypothetical protein